MRAVRIVILGLLWCSASLSAQSRYYGAIDLGSKGVKAALYSFIREAEGLDTRVLLKNTINTKLTSSMNDARFTAEGIQDAVDATRRLFEQMQDEAKKRRIAEVKYYIVGSSGISKTENREDLAAAVKKVTGIEMEFIDARDEGYFGLSSTISRDQRSTAVYIDIGSGNTKLGCVVGGSEVSNFKSVEIPYGSVSGRNAATKRNSADIRAGIEQLMQDEVRPAYSKQSMDTPCLRNRQTVYWTGGAAWATATMMHPEKVLSAYVRITPADLDTFLGRLSDGTWNQKKLTYNFSKGTSKKDESDIRAKAEKERNNVMDIFAAEDLLAGVSIMKTVLDASNPSAVIRFARNGNYIYGYAIEKYKEDRNMDSPKGSH
jgi:exopolyphosphatase/pppGpp-phosphohydrolase